MIHDYMDKYSHSSYAITALVGVGITFGAVLKDNTELTIFGGTLAILAALVQTADYIRGYSNENLELLNEQNRIPKENLLERKVSGTSRER